MTITTSAEIIIYNPLSWENLPLWRRLFVYVFKTINYSSWKYLDREVLLDYIEIITNYFERWPHMIVAEYYGAYRKLLFDVIFTYRFLAFCFGLYMLLTIFYSWVPWVMALKRGFVSYRNLANHADSRLVLASLEDVENIPDTAPPAQVEGQPPVYDPVDWTNHQKLSSTLVMECKLEVVFSKYSEANKLVVERWVNKRLEVLSKRGLRLAHRKRVKDRFMVLIFLKDAYEMEMQELQNSAIVQEHLKAGLRQNRWYYIRDSSTLYLPWFRRVLEPGDA